MTDRYHVSGEVCVLFRICMYKKYSSRFLEKMVPVCLPNYMAHYPRNQ